MLIFSAPRCERISSGEHSRMYYEEQSNAERMYKFNEFCMAQCIESKCKKNSAKIKDFFFVQFSSNKNVLNKPQEKLHRHFQDSELLKLFIFANVLGKKFVGNENKKKPLNIWSKQTQWSSDNNQMLT